VGCSDVCAYPPLFFFLIAMPRWVDEGGRFANVTEPPSTEAIHSAVHRAVVEVYTHALNGKPVDTPVVDGRVAGEGFTSRVRIEVRQNGEAMFHYGDESVEGEILGMSTRVEGEGVTGEWLQEGLDGKGWVKLGFRGDDIKFAVHTGLL